MFQQVISIIDRKERKKFWFLLVMMFFGSFLEIIGLSSVVSLISMMLQSDLLEKNKYIRYIFDWFGFQTQKRFMIYATLAMIGIYVFKTVYLIAEYYLQSQFVKYTQHNTAMKLLNNVLYRPYEYFTNINTADIVRTVYDDVNQFSSCLYAYLQLMTESVIAVCIILYLFNMNFMITFYFLCMIAVLLAGIRFFMKKRVYLAGQIRQTTGRERLKWMNQAIHGIKEIKIGQNEPFFYNKYREADIRFARAEIRYQFWSKAPSYCMEAVMMVCILVLILFLTFRDADIMGLVPDLAAFALAAAKLLPACTHINGYLTQISYTKPSMELVGQELKKIEKEWRFDKSNSAAYDLKIKKGLSACNIDFTYAGYEKKILEGAQIEIPKGSAVGIIGKSGSGKTTVVDVLLGLLKPQCGEVCIDFANIESCYPEYLKKVAYIPQMIFLLDDTIRNNVAFGMESGKISDDKIWEALGKARLKEFVEKLPDKLDTQIGERGVRLSGGQRQRIGIARALFDDCEILVFDEATSALDGETEEAIMESVNHLKGDKTLIMIAHRMSTIMGCDKVYKVGNGKIQEVIKEKNNEENIIFTC